jgi:antitoxin CcdA
MTDSGRRAANLSISTELLEQARALDINLSATLERALLQAVRERQRALWKVEHRQAIAAYNAEVDKRGVFSDGLRGF